MNCDAIARWYALIEHLVFGRSLERCRNCFLPALTDVRRALVIGDGDGRFLRAFLAENPDVQVDCMDVSAQMLEQARARAGDARVRYVQADVLRDPWPGTDYDLVVTHFVLDCFDAAGQRALAGKAPRARWLVSEFRESGWCARVLIRLMYACFGIATGLKTRRLADHRVALMGAGYRPERCVEHRGGLLVSELWAVK